MITFTQGNPLEAKTEALVNVVNTEGVMENGTALQFEERFADHFHQYAQACKTKQVQTGAMFVTEVRDPNGPRWIIHFPTKQHWRAPSQMAWVVEGLQDLRRFLIAHQVKSIAIPSLGGGNGGLLWKAVRTEIERELGDLDLDILVYEPSNRDQHVTPQSDAETLTPALALIAELVRRYGEKGLDCSLLQIQKLVWFLANAIESTGLDNPLELNFEARRYGPYAEQLLPLLQALEGGYLHCENKISDAEPFSAIWFNEQRQTQLHTYLNSEASEYLFALEAMTNLINGFESSFGLELLATVDWMMTRESVDPYVPNLREGLRHWRGDPNAAVRKLRLFDDYALEAALNQLTHSHKV